MDIPEKSSKRVFGSFHIRYWLTGRARFVFRGEHIQSKRVTRVTSLDELMKWIFDEMNAEPCQLENGEALSPEQDREEE